MNSTNSLCRKGCQGKRAERGGAWETLKTAILVKMLRCHFFLILDLATLG